MNRKESMMCSRLIDDLLFFSNDRKIIDLFRGEKIDKKIYMYFPPLLIFINMITTVTSFIVITFLIILLISNSRFLFLTNSPLIQED